MDHSFDHTADATPPAHDAERRTTWAFIATLAFALVELAGGLFAGSLALLADSLHMFADASALLMAWGAFRLGRMAADAKRSYGYRRWEVLAALVNGVTLIGLSVGIVIEAVLRFLDPQAVQGGPMLGVAALGLVANWGIYRLLGHEHDPAGHHHERNLNLEGASLHVLGDLFGSVGAVVAGGVILLWNWTPVDPLLSILTSLIIVGGAVTLSRRAIHILLEGAPEGFDAADLSRRLMAAERDLVDVHHIHAWSLSSGQRALTLHIVVSPGADRDRVLRSVQRFLADEMGFPHSVVQIEGQPCHTDALSCG